MSLNQFHYIQNNSCMCIIHFLKRIRRPMTKCLVTSAIHAPTPTTLYTHVVFSHKVLMPPPPPHPTPQHTQCSRFVTSILPFRIPNWLWEFKVIMTNQSSNKNTEEVLKHIFEISIKMFLFLVYMYNVIYLKITEI